jgi:thiol:disulfide interchange protein
MSVWASFFGSDNYKGKASKSLGVKNRKGEDLNAIQIAADSKGRKTVTLYISAKDKLAKQAEFTIADQGVNETTILATKSISIDGSAGKDTFAFKAPEGSREISMEELNSGKWFTDLNEACALAKKTGKKVFVDFMATWCGPCKMLEREVFHSEDFKRLNKSFVMCQIDVDAQPDVAARYKVTAMPTQMVLDSDGNEIGKTVGYGGPAAFYNWIGAYAK